MTTTTGHDRVAQQQPGWEASGRALRLAGVTEGASYARFGVVCSPSGVEDGCCGGGFGGPPSRAPGLVGTRGPASSQPKDHPDPLGRYFAIPVRPATYGSGVSALLHHRGRRWGDGWVVDHVQDLDPVEWGRAAGMSFFLYFRQALLGLSEAYWLDGPPDLSCKDSTPKYPVDGPLLIGK